MDERKPQPADIEKCQELFVQAVDFIYLKHAERKKDGHPFLAHFIQNLRYTPTLQPPCSLAAVIFLPNQPHGIFYYNPENCKGLNLLMFSGLMVHEILHLLLNHTKEIKVILALGMLANWAFDLEVNEIVVQMGYQVPYGDYFMADGSNFVPITVPLIPQILLQQYGVVAMNDKANWPERGQDWQYYLTWLLKWLPAEAQQQLRDQGKGNHDWEPGDEEGGEDGLDADGRGAREANINNAVERARDQAGQDPGDLLGNNKLANAVTSRVKALRPTTPWRKHLVELIANCGQPKVASRRRFNRHDTIGLGTMLEKDILGVVVDMSYSTKRQRGTFFGEIRNIARMYETEVMIQLVSHGKIGRRMLLSDFFDQENFAVKGGGGTCLRDGIMSYVDDPEEDTRKVPGAIVVLTDGDLGLDSIVKVDELKGIPLLWGSTNARNPFEGHEHAGKWVHIEDCALKENV